MTPEPPAQQPLDLPVRATSGRGDFFVSAANRDALAEIDRWRDWPGGRMALTGPEGSGKSHLARIWADQSGAAIMTAPAETEAQAVVLEDADRAVTTDAAQVALFHLINRMAETGGALLLTARAAPARWGVTLPDLATRLEATPVARLSAPDDALFAALIVKLFADRQVAVGPEVIKYLTLRLERSASAAQTAVERIDRRALAEKRRISTHLARDALGL